MNIGVAVKRNRGDGKGIKRRGDDKVILMKGTFVLK